MTYGDLKKKLYCDAFLQLCETRDLSSITVTNVIEAAGTARQTFYNHFSDINELIGYIPINFLETYGHPIYFAETVYEAYNYALEHKGFFSQLPRHSGQNNFRDTFLHHMREFLKSEFLRNDLDEQEQMYRTIAIEQTIIGVTDTFLEWGRGQMEWPVDMLVRVQYDTVPAFMQAQQKLPPRLWRAHRDV